MQRIQRLHAVQPFRFGIPDLIADLHLAPRVVPFQNEDFCLLLHADAAVTLAGRSAQAESGVGICLILRFAVLGEATPKGRSSLSRRAVRHGRHRQGNRRAAQALKSVEDRLDSKFGIVLLQPAYTKYYLNLGEISLVSARI